MLAHSAALWRQKRPAVIISMLLCLVNVAFVFWGMFAVDADCLMMLMSLSLTRHYRGMLNCHLRHMSSTGRKYCQGPHVHWDPTSSRCVETDASRNRLNYLIGCIADLLNLILALGGIWTMKCDGKFWKLLYYQVCPVGTLRKAELTK